jgi:hypothetical protein
MNDYQITDAMMNFGGSFVSMLARTFRCADYVNQQRIKDTWPELWTEYARLAQLKAERAAKV